MACLPHWDVTAYEKAFAPPLFCPERLESAMNKWCPTNISVNRRPSGLLQFWLWAAKWSTQWTWWVWTNSGVGDGQGGQACHSAWGLQEVDTTEQLNSNKAERETTVTNLIFRKSTGSQAFLNWVFSSMWTSCVRLARRQLSTQCDDPIFRRTRSCSPQPRRWTRQGFSPLSTLLPPHPQPLPTLPIMCLLENQHLQTEGSEHRAEISPEALQWPGVPRTRGTWW